MIFFIAMLDFCDLKTENIEEYGPNLKILPSNDQIKELQTILRDRDPSRSAFKFYADRLGLTNLRPVCKDDAEHGQSTGRVLAKHELEHRLSLVDALLERLADSHRSLDQLKKYWNNMKVRRKKELGEETL
uniref:Uncharacterized protein n=1 Tax=Timema poppense TaxID=170557 RepID=A0A7R9H0J1_TIMPO|nr:unnamed protein product [Timema poppensis]